MSEPENEDSVTSVVEETNQEEMSQGKRDMYLGIFMELCKSHRFNKFLNDNFTFSQMVDEEKKEIDLRIIEKPTAVGPPLTVPQVQAIYKACSASGVIDTQGLVSKILAILGQEDPNRIILASDDDLKSFKS